MLLTVGRVVRPHGVRGEVLVEVATDEPGARFVAGAVLAAQWPERVPEVAPADQRPAALRVAAQRPHQGRLIVAFAEVPDRTAAEALRGVLLAVDSEQLPPPADPDEFHDYQLVGLTAVTPEGEPLGRLARVDHAPAADLLVLERPDGRGALVPFVKEIVPEVDLPAGRVVIDPPAGLLDL